MNLNKALFLSFGILALLVLATVFHVNRLKSAGYENVIIDDEILITHIHCLPEITRSYEKVKDVYGKKSTLVFRYSNNSCSSCIIYYLNEILALQEEIGKEHIWIYPAYPDDRSSRIQLSVELAKYNYRNIPADSLFIPTYEGEQKSYFAWINNEGEIDMVFIPDIHNKPYTSRFFFEVKKMLGMVN